ncbi:hypothetical protein [Bifidobacterium adolescentis]|uniref:DUF4245 domain-containing protein n=1 Tax=Bifidobacterium adolescentis TaxID=1680 RepID=A0A412KAB9_BIFAD|nr:hypothetical protein [Bifidobacterium adolescentis]RGS65776.1 hypothetical protein DWX79_01365 [Bifidobacterium adolescentis]
MTSMSDTQNSSSHGKLIAAVVAAALVVVLALISAFVWPGWALNKNGQAGQAGQTSQQASTSNGTDGDRTEPTKPSIDAVALPDGASELLKAMPDSVLNYARTKADASTTWSSTSPVEEYALTYSTGKKGQDVTLEVGQWNDGDKAKSQYDTLAEAMTGKELGSGNVKVSGKTTGAYSAKANPDDDTKAVAVWRNDTVVFYATGAKNDIQRFYQQFPL